MASRLPFFSKASNSNGEKPVGRTSLEEEDRTHSGPPKWSFGVLNDKETFEVPGKLPNLMRCLQTNTSQAPYFCSQITKTSPSVCAMRQLGRLTHLFLQLRYHGPKWHKATGRRKLQMRRSFWSRSPRTLRMTLSTGLHGAETLLCYHWVFTVWWAVA